MRKVNFLQMIGSGLIVCGLLLAVFSCFSTIQASKQMERAVQEIQKILPPPTPGVMDQYSSMEMPALQIDGKNYVGLLDIPAFGITLPIGATWSALTAGMCPSRFCGSVYDGSLAIGGTDRNGQLDFLERLQIGDAVEVTDMTGARFRYTVSWIQRSTSADMDVLVKEGSKLTLFAGDRFSLEYVIVFCE